MARLLIISQGDPDQGEWLSDALAQIGHQILMATNSAQGLRLMDTTAPDLVITDVLLPELDRLEAFRRLHGRSVPKIIAITGNLDLRIASGEPEWHGASRTLRRPFTQGDLIAAVKSVLAERLLLVSLVHSGLKLNCHDYFNRSRPQYGRILIIEDDPDMRELLVEVLESAGHEVLVAVDGAQGLRMLREEAPDLVLTDIIMPNMDGLELLQALQAAEAGSKIKIVAISGAPPRWLALKTAEDLGARKTLAKPFTRQEVIEVIDTVLAGD